jgi:hypothetical protein
MQARLVRINPAITGEHSATSAKMEYQARMRADSGPCRVVPARPHKRSVPPQLDSLHPVSSSL